MEESYNDVNNLYFQFLQSRPELARYTQCIAGDLDILQDLAALKVQQSSQQHGIADAISKMCGVTGATACVCTDTSTCVAGVSYTFNSSNWEELETLLTKMRFGSNIFTVYCNNSDRLFVRLVAAESNLWHYYLFIQSDIVKTNDIFKCSITALQPLDKQHQEMLYDAGLLEFFSNNDSRFSLTMNGDKRAVLLAYIPGNNKRECENSTNEAAAELKRRFIDDFDDVSMKSHPNTQRSYTGDDDDDGSQAYSTKVNRLVSLLADEQPDEIACRDLMDELLALKSSPISKTDDTPDIQSETYRYLFGIGCEQDNKLAAGRAITRISDRTAGPDDYLVAAISSVITISIPGAVAKLDQLAKTMLMLFGEFYPALSILNLLRESGLLAEPVDDLTSRMAKSRPATTEVLVYRYLRMCNSFHISTCYLLGIGVEQDTRRAYYIVRRAAQRGHADANYIAGLCCLNGFGTNKNIEAARSYMQKCADYSQFLVLLTSSLAITLGDGDGDGDGKEMMV